MATQLKVLAGSVIITALWAVTVGWLFGYAWGQKSAAWAIQPELSRMGGQIDILQRMCRPGNIPEEPLLVDTPEEDLSNATE